MSNKTLIWIVTIWMVLTVINYYLVPYFIVVLEWILLLFIFLFWFIIEIIKLIRKRIKGTQLSIGPAATILILLLLTYWRPQNRMTEKIDWYIFYNRRSEIVRQVKNDELKPNVSWNGWICELPYEFPVVSNGGNDIGISKNDSTDNVTVTFWVFRNFFSAPSTHFIYTNDPEKIKQIDGLIARNPGDNWKIEENWYRTLHE